MIFPLLIGIVLLGLATLAWKDLNKTLILLCALTPTYLIRSSLGSVPTTLFELFALIVIIRFLFTFRSWKIDYRFKPFHLFFVLIGVAAIIGMFIAPDRLSALGILKAYYIEPFILGAIMLNRFTRKDFKLALLAWFGSGIMLSLFAFIQIGFHVGIPEAWATESRATSLFPYPNALGLFLAPLTAALMLGICTSYHKLKDQRKKLYGSIALAMLFLVAIVLAKTEAALIAIPVAVIFTLLLSPSFSQRSKSILSTGSVALAILALALVPSLAQKVMLHDTSGLVRRAQWSETLLMLANHPYLGVGLNAYPTALAPYHNATVYEIFQYPHNIFLNVWSELGLIGLIGLIGLMSFSLHFAWKNKKDPWVLACFTALLAMVIHGLVDVPFFKNDLAVMSVFFFVGMVRRDKNSRV